MIRNPDLSIIVFSIGETEVGIVILSLLKRLEYTLPLERYKPYTAYNLYMGKVRKVLCYFSEVVLTLAGIPFIMEFIYESQGGHQVQ